MEMEMKRNLGRPSLLLVALLHSEPLRDSFTPGESRGFESK